MQGFRQSFGHVSRNLNWFPKHMNTGIKQMQAKLRSVDCILEIHDARIPLTGRNPNFSHMLVGDKPHIVVLNKVDLISYQDKKRIREIYEKSVTKNLIFTNCKDDRDEGVRKVVPMVRNLIETSNRFHRAGLQEYNAMIIGIPNVGKSSFINIVRAKNLRKARSLQVAPSAGVTKSVHMKVKICEKPRVFLFDTPGILTPRVSDPNSSLKLAACGSFPDHAIGEMLIADYMLFLMNKRKNFSYTEWLQLDEPCDCITTIFTKGAINLDKMIYLKSTTGEGKIKKPDFEGLAKMFIEKFRQTEFGKIVIDDLDEFIGFDACTEEELELKENEFFERSRNT